MLPFGLLAEWPLARAFANIILDNGEIIVGPLHLSLVHGAAINTRLLQDFIQRHVLLHEEEDDQEEEHEFGAFELEAATLILVNQINLRCGAYSPFQHHLELRKYMHGVYLPLASNTQFVEAGVKEASLASKTGRHEEMRSIYCINRSSTVLATGVNRDTKPTDKIRLLMNAAKKKEKYHSALKEEGGKVRYDAAINGIKQELLQNHYKHERVDRQTQAIIDTANTNKVANQRQLKEGVDASETMLAMGHVAYSKVVSSQGHLSDLVQELTHRGYDTWNHGADYVDGKGNPRPNKRLTFTDLKVALKELEIERITGDEEAVEWAQKSFLVLSEATFKQREKGAFVVAVVAINPCQRSWACSC